MVIAGFEISESTGRAWLFEKTFFIANVPQPVV